jgi:hypothetical protein
MTIQTINLGNYANDGTGDDLRTAFEKVNANFQSLLITDLTNAANLTGGAGLFKDKSQNTLNFKSIKAGTNVTITEQANTVTVNSSGVLNSDLNPTLAGDLNINGFDLISTETVNLTAPGLVASGEITATKFNGFLEGQVSSISNLSLSDLGDVSNEIPLLGQALVWQGAEWAADTVAGVGGSPNLDGGSADIIYDIMSIKIDGGFA